MFAAPAKQVFTKNIKKEFSVSANGTCEISNMYGIVELKTWDKNRVKVDVLISIKLIRKLLRIIPWKIL